MLAVQPSHIISDARWLPSRLGKNREAQAGAWRSMLRTGIDLAGGSDAPIDEISPVVSMIDAVHRPLFHPQECITRLQALALYTKNAAFAATQEKLLGRIAPGFAANLTVLDRDFLRLPIPEARASRVRATIVAGEALFVDTFDKK